MLRLPAKLLVTPRRAVLNVAQEHREDSRKRAPRNQRDETPLQGVSKCVLDDLLDATREAVNALDRRETLAGGGGGKRSTFGTAQNAGTNGCADVVVDFGVQNGATLGETDGTAERTELPKNAMSERWARVAEPKRLTKSVRAATMARRCSG